MRKSECRALLFVVPQPRSVPKSRRHPRGPVVAADDWSDNYDKRMIGMMHDLRAIGVPCSAWCLGSRHWTRNELMSVKMERACMTWRIAGLWPKAGEVYPQYVRRTTRGAEALRESTGVTRLDAAVACVVARWRDA